MELIGIIGVMSVWLGVCGSWDRELYDAASNGYLNKVVQFLLVGADPNWGNPDNLNRTAVHVAAKSNHASVLLLLLNAHGDIEARDSHGEWTPLHVATVFGSPLAVTTLLSHGANIEARGTINGGTPLMYAGMLGWSSIAQTLLTASPPANVAAADNNGWTALHEAARSNHQDTAKVLLSHWADPKQRDNSGRTPADVARAFSNYELAAVIDSFSIRATIITTITTDNTTQTTAAITTPPPTMATAAATTETTSAVPSTVTPVSICRDDQFQCDAEKCIRQNWRCDGEMDCADGSDEVNCDSCMEPFLNFGGQCLTLIAKDGSWDAHLAECLELGGSQLVEFTNKSLSLVKSYLGDRVSDYDVCIGGRKNEEGTFKWPSGQIVNLSWGWNEVEPNNVGGNEDCMVISEKGFNDIPCGTFIRGHSMCEMLH